LIISVALGMNQEANLESQGFPFTPPDASVRVAFAGVLSLTTPLDERWIKLVFDKTISLLALTAASPILCAIFVSHFVLIIFLPDQRGKLLISYKAVSKGRVFPKYKFRVTKEAFIDKGAAVRCDWQAYAAEWNPDSRTYLGVVLKRLYLDELPQLLNILLGHMSVVGPRPLAVHHYDRDFAQGNTYRQLIKAGLFGPSQALKGTRTYGNPKSEYEYVDKYIKLSGLKLLWCDLKLIGGGLRVVAQAKGL
jgi:lipopolysaccharide/colanic/teichoic acid biosynthesis glycosyltransferase